MSWLVPNDAQPMPLSTELRRLLLDIKVSELKLENSAIRDFLTALRKIFVNGGACFGCFEVQSNPTLDWLISRNQVDLALDRAPLLQSDAVFQAFPELVREPRLLREPKWEGVSDLTFAGELAHSLRLGGAYESLSTPRALELAEKFRTALFQERYDDVLILRTFTPWNAWFCDLAWDQTWFILDKRLKRFSLLLWTDTD